MTEDKGATARAEAIKTGLRKAPLGPETPSAQPAGNGPEHGVRGALEQLAERPNHDPETGQFVDGNTAAGCSLSRSTAFWGAVGVAKRELIDRLHSDLAVDAGRAAVTLEGLIDGYAEARLLRTAMFIRLTELPRGAVTAKGNTRALFNTYLSALDREVRLALTLGTERKSRDMGLADYVARKAREADNSESGGLGQLPMNAGTHARSREGK